MANPVTHHKDQPIVIDKGNPTELIFRLSDPPESGIDTWTAEFLLKTDYAPAGDLVGEALAGQMNKGEDGEDEDDSIRILIPSTATAGANVATGTFYRWDLWRTDGPEPQLLAQGTATIRKTVRFPTSV